MHTLWKQVKVNGSSAGINQLTIDYIVGEENLLDETIDILTKTRHISTETDSKTEQFKNLKIISSKVLKLDVENW